MTSSPEPHFGVNIEEEMNQSYVKAYRSEFDVPDDKLVEAIEYLGRLVGGKLYSELWCSNRKYKDFWWLELQSVSWKFFICWRFFFFNMQPFYSKIVNAQINDIYSVGWSKIMASIFFSFLF